jgi:hypothetical protein
MMNFYIVFFLVICCLLVGVTIVGKDFSPFSYYPMFSGRHHLQHVKVFRLALETQNGKIEWWQHEAYRYPEFVGRQLLRFYDRLNGTDKKSTALLSLEKHKLLLEVLRIIEADGYSINYKAFHIVERTVSNNFKIVNKTMEVISFTELKRGKIS